MSMKVIKDVMEISVAQDYQRVSFSMEAAKAAITEYEQLQAELDKYRAIEENNWDLQCIDVSTCGDDCDIEWIVVEHYQAEPRKRIVGRGKTPLVAIEQALKEEE